MSSTPLTPDQAESSRKIIPDEPRNETLTQTLTQTLTRTDFSILSKFFRFHFDKYSISMHVRDRAHGQGLANGKGQLTLTG